MDTYVIAWNEAMRLGDETTDAQHHLLIELIAGIPDRPTSDDEQLLQDVLAYAGYHFADEEGLMERIEYPQLAEHRRAHKTLSRTLFAYKREYDEGQRDLYSFKHFMYRWVRDHIMDEDRRIGDFLRAGRDRRPTTA
jgi:hemerythrin